MVGRQQMAEEGANRLRRRRNLNRMMANRMANSAQREAADNGIAQATHTPRFHPRAIPTIPPLLK